MTPPLMLKQFFSQYFFLIYLILEQFQNLGPTNEVRSVLGAIRSEFVDKNSPLISIFENVETYSMNLFTNFTNNTIQLGMASSLITNISTDLGEYTEQIKNNFESVNIIQLGQKCVEICLRFLEKNDGLLAFL